MEENKTPAASFWSKKNIVIVAAVAVLTVALYMLGSGTFFKASLLDLKSAPEVQRVVYPLKETFDWTNPAVVYAKFKSGELNYDNGKDFLIPIPTYTQEARDAICQLDKSTKEKKNIINTYVTPFLGKYTSGLTADCGDVGSHSAVDIKAPEKTPVYAIAEGMVSKVQRNGANGNVVCIYHRNAPGHIDPSQKENLISCYLHLFSIQDTIQEGANVAAGDMIGLVGSTGTATTKHLHFQIDLESAPFHPYWPFTSAEATAAGCDFFSCVEQGLGRDKASQYTIDGMKYVEDNKNFNNTVSAGTPDVKIATTTTTTTTTTGSDEKKNENTQPANPQPNANAVGTTSTITTTTTTTTAGSSSGGSTTTTAAGAFSDVPDSHPNRVAIYGLKDLGVLSGNPDGTFKPDDPVNRAAMCKIALLAYKKDQAQKADVQFTDMTSSDWFYELVRSCVSHGIFKGYSDNTYRGGNSIQWPELAVVISRLKTLPAASCTNADQVPEWARDGANQVCGIMGFQEFPVSRSASRAEVAEIVWKTINLN